MDKKKEKKQNTRGMDEKNHPNEEKDSTKKVKNWDPKNPPDKDKK